MKYFFSLPNQKNKQTNKKKHSKTEIIILYFSNGERELLRKQENFTGSHR